MANYRDTLPHRSLSTHPVHVTYRLANSIPTAKIRELLHQQTQLFGNRKTIDEQGIITSRAEWTETAFEQLLHYESNGPYFLQQDAVRQIILNSWFWIAERHQLYIYAICIMGNHIHILLQTLTDTPLEIGRIMKSHKSFCALEANKLLGRTGHPFWAKGYYDRDLRPNQFATLMWYILNNPVKAGLVNNWRDWQGTFLNPDYDELFR